MSDLNPRGVGVVIGGEERKLLFTINAVDEIQDRLNMPFLDTMQYIAHIADGSLLKEDLMIFRVILSVLISTRNKKISEVEVGDMIEFRERIPVSWKILEAYGISMPEPEEDEDDDEDDEDDPKITAGT